MDKQDTLSLKDLPLEIRMSAYLDGQTNNDEVRELEALIASDEEARALFDTLVLGSAIGDKVFDDMLKEPVPLHLVRAIKHATKATEIAPSTSRPANNNFFAFMPRALAASLVLVLASGYSGYFIGLKNADRHSAKMSETSEHLVADKDDRVKTRSFEVSPDGAFRSLTTLDLVVGYHTVYSAQDEHMVEVSAKAGDKIKTWLRSATTVNFQIPDLSRQGFEFKGARLLAVNRQPMGTLFYRNAMNQTVMIGFFDLGKTITQTVSPEIKDHSVVTYFSKNTTGIFLVLPLGVALDKMMDSVAAEL